MSLAMSPLNRFLSARRGPAHPVSLLNVDQHQQPPRARSMSSIKNVIIVVDPRSSGFDAAFKECGAGLRARSRSPLRFAHLPG